MRGRNDANHGELLVPVTLLPSDSFCKLDPPPPKAESYTNFKEVSQVTGTIGAALSAAHEASFLLGCRL